MDFDQRRFHSSEMNGKISIPMEDEDVIEELPDEKSLHLFESRKSGKLFLIIAFFLTLVILIPYTLRFRNGELNPMVSRLSQDCESSWQNGFFNICLYLTSLFGMLVITLRYMYVSNLIDESVPKMHLVNKYGLWFGYICFFGFLLVAAVPLDIHEDVRVHLSSSSVGGFIIFFFGALYICFQTSITFFYSNVSKRVLAARVFIFFAACITFGIYCFVVNTITKPDYEKPVFLTSTMISMEDGTISLYKRLTVLGAICEWMTGVLFALYFLTFAKECQQIWVEVTFTRQKRIDEESSEAAM